MALNLLGTMALNLRLDSAKVINRSMALWHSNLLGTMALNLRLDSAKVINTLMA